MSGNKNGQPKMDPTWASIQSPIYPAHLPLLGSADSLLAGLALVQAYDLFFATFALELITTRALPVFLWGATFVPKEIQSHPGCIRTEVHSQYPYILTLKEGICLSIRGVSGFIHGSYNLIAPVNPSLRKPEVHPLKNKRSYPRSSCVMR